MGSQLCGFGLSGIQGICVCVHLSDGTSAAPPAARLKLNTRTFLLGKAKVKAEQSTQADGGTDVLLMNTAVIGVQLPRLLKARS